MIRSSVYERSRLEGRRGWIRGCFLPTLGSLSPILRNPEPDTLHYQLDSTKLHNLLCEQAMFRLVSGRPNRRLIAHTPKLGCGALGSTITAWPDFC